MSDLMGKNLKLCVFLFLDGKQRHYFGDERNGAPLFFSSVTFVVNTPCCMQKMQMIYSNRRPTQRD